MEKNQENLWEFLRDFSSDKMSLVREAMERTERETSWTLCIQRFNGRKKIPREEAVLQQSPCLWEAASSEPPHSSSATRTPLLWQSWPQRATPSRRNPWHPLGCRHWGPGAAAVSAPSLTALNSLTWSYRSKMTLLVPLLQQESHLCPVLLLCTVYYHGYVERGTGW